MRTLMLSAVIALATGCTNTVEHAEAPQPGKSLAYYSNNDAEYRQAAQSAEEWCRETYDSSARYLNRRHDAAGNVVIFGCTAD